MSKRVNLGIAVALEGGKGLIVPNIKHAEERNLLGKGQELRFGVSLGTLSTLIDLSFTEPYFLGYRLAAGFDAFYKYSDLTRYSRYETTVYGGQLRLGLPITEEFGITLRAIRFYEDKGLPGLKDWLGRAVRNPIEWVPKLIPDERETIAATLRELVDAQRCDLVLTTGGTGPAPRDVTPEATLAVADREMPGFGEQMRRISLEFVPTAILSRQVAVIRGKCLIINLPGQPKSIRETLEGLRDADGKPLVPGIFAAVPYCIDLIGGPYIETDETRLIEYLKNISKILKTICDGYIVTSEAESYLEKLCTH